MINYLNAEIESCKKRIEELTEFRTTIPKNFKKVDQIHLLTTAINENITYNTGYLDALTNIIESKFGSIDIIDEAVRYTQTHSFEDNRSGSVALLIGDVAQLIQITTGMEVDPKSLMI